jgi:geranylgeranyl diphosphate synthase type II
LLQSHAVHLASFSSICYFHQWVRPFMRDFQSRYLQYKRLIDRRFKSLADEDNRRPRSLMVPLKYVLSGGGKRLRPVLLLLAYEAVSSKPKGLRMSDGVLNAALAVEALHNFTLVHDDIMDDAPSRRGRATVHSKWDENTAILVGDELVALAYRTLLRTRSPRIGQVLKIFTDGLLEVCEGQGLDKEFEQRRDVTLAEYLKMIEMKTGRMVSVGLEIGALLGGGNTFEVDALRRFGYHVGRAFQIQDDLLDVIGDERFGKKIGGDIVEGKKTFLLLQAYRMAKREDRDILERVISGRGVTRKEVGTVKRIYEKHGAVECAKKEVRKHVIEAQRALESLQPSSARDMLHWLAGMLQDRSS